MEPKSKELSLILCGVVLFIMLIAAWVPATSGVTPSIVGIQVDGAAAIPADALQVIDYGSFKWVQVSAESRTASQNTATPYALRIGNTTINTNATVLPHPTSTTKDLHLVQLAGPTKTAWATQLEAAGLEIIQYIHPFSYIVWGSPAQLSSLNASNFVRWMGPYSAELRHPNQNEKQTDATATWQRVLVYRNAPVAAVSAQLAQLSGRPAGVSDVGDAWISLSAQLNGKQVSEIAKMAGVGSIQAVGTYIAPRTELSAQIVAGNYDSNGLPQLGYQNWMTATGITGAGVRVAVVDEGIYLNHPDLVGQFTSCTGLTCGSHPFFNYHGTHVSAILGGTGASGITDGAGFLRGQGVAPGATLIAQTYTYTDTQSIEALRLMEESAENGAVISSNSWGFTVDAQGYDYNTRLVDIGVRDAMPDKEGNQSLTYVLAMWNGNGGTQTQGSPDEAKNTITVGSSRNSASNGVPETEINRLGFNTAHGPALDGRAIPTLVAPGCWVDSAAPPDNYGVQCGNSMATPHVAGAAALFVEYYRNLTGGDPSPALIKAALTGTAINLAGNYDADSNPISQPPSATQGWGRAHVGNAIVPDQPVIYADAPATLINSGDIWQATFTAATANEPMHLMLVWTDSPGHGLGGDTPAWTNDLDLIVTAGNDTFVGNNFDDNGWSQVGGSADSMHNTEAVFIQNATNTVSVEVRGSNINSDGVPNNDANRDQDFALICYNCVQPSVESSFNKVGSRSAASIGDEVAFSLDFNVGVAGASTVTGVLTDVLPAELSLVPQTLRANGVMITGAYNPDTHQIVLPISADTFTEEYTMRITYKTVVESNAVINDTIDNMALTTVFVNGNRTAIELSAGASVLIEEPSDIYLPFLAP